MKKIKELLKNILETLIVSVFLSIPVILTLTMWAFSAPTGHYEGTETMQPDGTYYVWVEE